MKNAELFYSTFSGGEKLFIRSHQQVKALEIGKVLFCMADGNYTKVYSAEGDKNETCKSLCEFEKLLKRYDFFRIHNSFLVNLKRVESFSRKNSFVTVAGCKIPISKRKWNEIFPILIDFGIKEVINEEQLINIFTG